MLQYAVTLCDLYDIWSQNNVAQFVHEHTFVFFVLLPLDNL